MKKTRLNTNVSNFFLSRMNKPVSIIRGEGFYNSIMQIENDKDLMIWFREKKKRISREDVSYRIVNYWSGMGLLDDVRRGKDKGNKWRKFSLIDFIWIDIMMELKKFGLPNEKILKVKQSLFIREKDKTYFPLLEYYTTLVKVKKNRVNLLVFSDGFCEIATTEEVDIANYLGSLNENFIAINYNIILEKILKSKELSNDKKPLNKQELEVIKEIRNEAFKKVEIILNSGEIQRINLTENINFDSKKVIEIIKEKKYQRIIIDTQNGNILNLERTEKRKTQ